MKKFLNTVMILIFAASLTNGCIKKETIQENIETIIPLKTKQEVQKEAEKKDEIAQIKADISQKKLEKLSEKKETFEKLSYKDEFKEAENSYKAQNYTDAILGFTDIIKTNPKNYKAHCLLAMSYAKKGENSSAEMVLTRAVELFPDEWNAYTILGDIKRSEHNYALAIEYYKKALASPKIPDEGKVHYLKEIEKVKDEQNNWDKKASNLGIITNSVELNLDKEKWELAYNAGNDKNWIVEYGLKGEDVMNYNWTQLVTVQFFEKDFYKKTPEEHILNQLYAIEKMAINTQKMFQKSVISNKTTDIVYEWSFDKGKESEIARVFVTDKGMYHLHYAKKGTISTQEKTQWLEILNKAKVKE